MRAWFIALGVCLTACVTIPPYDFNQDRIKADQINANNIRIINERYDSYILPPNPKDQAAADSHNILIEIKRERALRENQEKYFELMRAIDRSEASDQRYRDSVGQFWSNTSNQINNINTQNRLNTLESRPVYRPISTPQPSGILMPSK